MDRNEEQEAAHIENLMLVEDDNFIVRLVFVAKGKTDSTTEKMVLADVSEIISFKFFLN